jgi:hypothetical protein
MVNVDFDSRFLNFTALEGDYKSLDIDPMPFRISIGGLNSGLSRFAPVELRWIRESDGWVHNLRRQNLSGIGIDPYNPDSLSHDWWHNSGFSWGREVRIQDAGVYRLHIYVADERIAVSDPFTLNVIPDPGIAALNVDFVHHTRQATFRAGATIGTFEPISVNLNFDQMVQRTMLSPTTRVFFP